MTQDLKFTVYGLAMDGDNGIECNLFADKAAHVAAAFSYACPDDCDEGSFYQALEGQIDRVDGFVGEVDWRMTTGELSIDLATVPAVAALIRRNAELEAFMAGVAAHITTEDMVRDDSTDGHEPTEDEINEMRERFDDESMLSDHLTLEGFVADARALASPDANSGTHVAALKNRADALDALNNDLWYFIENVTDDDPERQDEFFALRERFRDLASPDAAPAKPYLRQHLETLIEQIKSTSAWEDAEAGEDDQLLADVTAAEAAIGGAA